MKDDFTLKGEVISHLEEIEDPAKDQNLLDAHMIEEVEVDGGVVDMVFVVESGRSRDERFALEDEIYESLEAIDGVREVKIKTMTPKALEQEQSGADEAAAEGAGAEAEAGAGGPGGAPGGPASGGPGGAMGGGGGPAAGAGGPAGGQSTSVPEAEPLEGVGNVLAVASGKGGVGKSTVARAIAEAVDGEVLRTDVIRQEIVDNPVYT
ncbi:MAG: iron-sulfur cluster assembly protein, partial [Bradymonadaceae bacterium]